MPHTFTNGEAVSKVLWPKLVVMGSGLQARLFERGLFEQFKRLTHLKPSQQKLERLCQQNTFRLLPATSQNKQHTLLGVLSGETQAGTRYVQGLLESNLFSPTQQSHLEAYCVGPVPAQRLEWHSLWQSETLQKAMKKLTKVEKAALESTALQMGSKLSLFYPGEPACLQEPSLAGQTISWPEEELKRALTLLQGYAQHLGLLACPNSQKAWASLASL
jgi:hypothetical protein